MSGGQKKKLVIALSLISAPKVLLLDECFAALDVLTIKMLQEIIVNLQNENKITICICDHQARPFGMCRCCNDFRQWKNYCSGLTIKLS